MTRSQDTTFPTQSVQKRPFRFLPLLALLARIVAHADREALRELHDNRAVFKLNDGKPLRLVPFIAELSNTRWARKCARWDHTALDIAYDIVIDKFVNLPRDEAADERPQHVGPDCRHYYRACMRVISAWRRHHPSAHRLEEEASAARILQRAVVKHFRLSCNEARRRCVKIRSRYAWQVNGSVMRLWMPVSLIGCERRKWLAANVDNLEPTRPGERDRIQQIIDDYFGVPARLPLSCADGAWASAKTLAVTRDGVRDGERTAYTLAGVVADEKADRIDDLRPAIRALGTERLKELIHQVFERLGNPDRSEAQLARAFGLSKASFSRFAGSQWTDAMRIPDLWLNTARMLGRHDPFVEAARRAGVWAKVRALVDGQSKRTTRSDGDAE